MKYSIKQHDDGMWYIHDSGGEQVGDAKFSAKADAQDKADAMNGNKQAADESYARPTKAAALVEALDLSEATMDTGGRVMRNVVLIRAGMSLNRRHYSESLLQKSAPLFEGVPAYDSHDRRARKVGETTGWYKNVRYEDGALRADRYFANTQAGRDVMGVAEDIVNHMAPPNVAGLSISAVGTVKQQKFEDGDAMAVESITKADSVDDVTTPAAGGTYIAASAGDAMTDALLKAMTFEEWFESRPEFVRRVQNEMKTVRQDEAVRAAKAEADKLTDAVKINNALIETLTTEREAALSEADTARRDLVIEKLLNAVALPPAWKDDLRKNMTEADPGEWAALIDSEKAKATTAGYKPRVDVTGAGAQEHKSAPVKEAVSLTPREGEGIGAWMARLASSS